MMQVTLKKGPYHRVEITGSWLDLDMSAKSAYELLQALNAKKEELEDMATNYYDCSTCGNTHHTSERCSKL